MGNAGPLQLIFNKFAAIFTLHKNNPGTEFELRRWTTCNCLNYAAEPPATVWTTPLNHLQLSVQFRAIIYKFSNVDLC